VSGVQNSVMVPYNMLTWLKKSTTVNGQYGELHNNVSYSSLECSLCRSAPPLEPAVSLDAGPFGREAPIWTYHARRSTHFHPRPQAVLQQLEGCRIPVSKRESRAGQARRA
jgi:hypothetical protein